VNKGETDLFGAAGGTGLVSCEVTPVRALRTDVFGRRFTDYLLGIYLETQQPEVGTMSFYGRQRVWRWPHHYQIVWAALYESPQGSLCGSVHRQHPTGEPEVHPGEKIGFFPRRAGRAWEY